MKIFFVIGLLVVGQFAFAQEAQVAPEIIEIRKSLPMEPTEKAVKDFILNRGADAGLKVGAYVNVVREVAVNDPVRNKALGALHIPVGKLHIIHVEDGLSVARLQSELGDDERPMLDYEALMIGDDIDMNSITMETPKASKKKVADSDATPAAQPIAPSTAQVVASTVEVSSVAPEEQQLQPQVQAPVKVAMASPITAPAKTLPAKVEPTSEPAFIITPIESDSDAPQAKNASVSGATAAN